MGMLIYIYFILPMKVKNIIYFMSSETEMSNMEQN